MNPESTPTSIPVTAPSQGKQPSTSQVTKTAKSPKSNTLTVTPKTTSLSPGTKPKKKPLAPKQEGNGKNLTTTSIPEVRSPATYQPDETTESPSTTVTAKQPAPQPSSTMVDLEPPKGFTSIAICEIQTLEKTEIRQSRSEKLIKQLQAVESDERHIVVVWNPSNPKIHNAVVDGRSRLKAAMANGETTVQVIYLRIADEKELYQEVVRLNFNHGAPLSRTEKQAAVKRLTVDGLTQEQISARIHVPQATISRLLREVEEQEKREAMKKGKGEAGTDAPTGPQNGRGRGRPRQPITQTNKWKKGLTSGFRKLSSNLVRATTIDALRAVIQQFDAIKQQLLEGIENPDVLTQPDPEEPVDGQGEDTESVSQDQDSDEEQDQDNDNEEVTTPDAPADQEEQQATA